MRKKGWRLLLICLMLCTLVFPASAEEFSGDSGWTVSFNGSKLDTNFTSGGMTEAVSDLQPGDSVTFTLALENTGTTSTDWWMTNRVLSSFEDNSIANGGAYTYILTYADAAGTENVLYSSENVGGESTTGGEGLHQATGALEDYFYLDTLASGSTGTITLTVALDGETQGNGYQNTLADLQMSFAVEETASASTGTTNNSNTTTTTTVRTGDESVPLVAILLMGGCGILLLILAIVSLKRRKKDDDKGAV
jgi:hypothetical protein